MGDRGFHRFRALQHEGKLHLAGAEQVAATFMPVQQDVIDDVERRVQLQASSSSSGRPCGSPSIIRSFSRPPRSRHESSLTASAALRVGEQFEARAAAGHSPRGGGRRSGLRRPAPLGGELVQGGGFWRRARSRRSCRLSRRGRGRRCSARRARPVQAETDVRQTENDLNVRRSDRGSCGCPPASTGRACGRPRCRWRW